MTTQTFDEAASARVDVFVSGLDDVTRQAAADWIKIPNTPDCQPEVVKYTMKYGAKGRQVTDQIETLRQELGLDYGVLQAELKKRLPD